MAANDNHRPHCITQPNNWRHNPAPGIPTAVGDTSTGSAPTGATHTAHHRGHRQRRHQPTGPAAAAVVTATSTLFRGRTGCDPHPS